MTTIDEDVTTPAFRRRASWAGHEVAPIEHPMFRFDRLVRDVR